MHFAQLREQIADTGEAFATLLRQTDDGSQIVSGSKWTVAEVGAHVVEVARRDIELLSGRESIAYPDGGDTHEAMAAMNDERMATVEERDPTELAALLIDANESLLDTLGPDPDQAAAWYHVKVSVQQFAGIWLGELLIHGLDVARTLGRGWPISRDQAVSVFEGLLPILPEVVDKEMAPKAAGTYHVRLRGGGDYTLTIEPDGSVVTEVGRPEKADLRVSASPVAYLLVGYGRLSQWPAIAKGQIRAWGRKPWLAPRFGSLFNAP